MCKLCAHLVLSLVDRGSHSYRIARQRQCRRMGQNTSAPSSGGPAQSQSNLLLGMSGYAPTDPGSSVQDAILTHPASKKGRAYTSAEDALRNMTSKEFVPPKATSVVKATENAPELGPRGLAISAAMSVHNPEMIQWQLVSGTD